MGEGAAERNRVQKVLEDANVKLGNVLTDLFGMSVRAMLEGLLENKRSVAEIAEPGHWSLAPKIPQIVEALEGQSNERSSPVSSPAGPPLHAIH